MKQQIQSYVELIRNNKKVMTGILLVFLGIVVYAAQNTFMGATGQSAAVITSGTSSETIDTLSVAEENIAVAGDDDQFAAISSGDSWPGEVISSAVSQIQPQREGVITKWRVRIGDTVSAGEVLGEISAAPAMPELVTMLAEKAEMASRSKAEAVIADKYAEKEQERYNALRNAINGNAALDTDFSFTALDSMRKEVDAMRNATRSFIERALSNHTLLLTNASGWRYVRYGSLNRQYGLYSQPVQNAYETALIKLADKLKGSNDLPIEEAENYFNLVVSLANNSGDEEMEKDFKIMAGDDQMNFLEMLSDYRMAQSKVTNMETEYKIMIKEGAAMVEKDRSMAHAEADAVETAYNTIAREITGGSYIISPRAGTVSAIYKKVGDLVNPMMSIAVIAGYGEDNFTVRIRIPNNIHKPSRGDVLSVVRPGFSKDVYRVKITGVGSTLDDTGSYMADALLLDKTGWSSGLSVRVIAPKDSGVVTVKVSSVWWDEAGVPHVWRVTGARRIFAQKITIGRTLGSSLEVYSGLKNGDRYVVHPTPDLREDMLLPEPVLNTNSSDKSNGEEGSMGGMEM